MRSAAAWAAAAVSATTTAMWSASQRLTSPATDDRPVPPSPTRTGWSNIVRPYSFTGTSAAVSTATTPGVASAAAVSIASIRA